MKDPKVLTIQDLSCYGQCSLTVALPIISACGLETAVIPTAVLSTHTAFKAGWTFRDLTDDIAPISDHWVKEALKFDCIYTGYLGSPRQVDLILSIIDRHLANDGAVIVDPAMADGGKLYAGFAEDFPSHMARLCAAADIILPNITEACLMTGKSNAREALDELAKYVPHPVVTLASEGAMFIENGEKVTLPAPKGDCIDATGAGDAFMGGFLYALNEGKSLAECVRFALAAGTATAGVKGCYADRSAYEEIRFGSRAEKNNRNI